MPHWTHDDARPYLLAMDRPPEERENHRIWVDHELPRFLRTLDLVPPATASQRCLEIGGMPYTFTLLMRRYHRYALSLVDFDASGRRVHQQTVRLPAFGETHELTSQLCDVEREELPFGAETFDGVLCCEVLEHLTTNPVAMLAQIHRVLKPAGWLIMTTPNVASMENVLALLHGRNIYSPYELVFGPTWRHNREYTSTEVCDLLRGTGFTIDELAIEDARPPGTRPSRSSRLLRLLLRAWYRQPYGGQLYVRARRGTAFRAYYPAWLFQHLELYRARTGTPP